MRKRELEDYWQKQKTVPPHLFHRYHEIHVGRIGYDKGKNTKDDSKVYRGYDMVMPARPEQVRPGSRVYIKGYTGYVFTGMNLTGHENINDIKTFMEEGLVYVRNYNHKIWAERDI